NRNIPLAGHSDNRSASLGIVRDNDQHVDILLVEQALGLVRLDGIVAVGGADQNIGSKLLCMRRKGISIVLPALFLERIQRQPYPDWARLSTAVGTGPILGAAHAGAEQKAADGYCDCWRQTRRMHSESSNINGPDAGVCGALPHIPIVIS